MSVDYAPAIQILGSRVHMVEIPEAVKLMAQWIESEPQVFHHVVNTGMHGIMEARRDPQVKAILNGAELFAPDGILVVLIARLRGFALEKRNTGPGLMWQFSHVAEEKGYKYFVYGDAEDTLQLLRGALKEAFPKLKIVGACSPPFRPLTLDEDEAIVSVINQAKPDVLWVGLGMPKQARWIDEHRDRLRVPVVVGAGASFKFLSGAVKRAPPWLGNLGFEWLWRLCHEPRRVWRRVFVDAPQFIALAVLELAGLKKHV